MRCLFWVTEYFKNETLISIGKKYGKTGPQVALRYLMERGVIVIPKSSKKERMAENLNIFDFALSDRDMLAIRNLNKEQRFFNMDYKQAEQFMLNWKIDD